MHPTADDQGDFASLLARIQQRTGMSDQRIADAAGVHRSQVWRWVNAGSAPGYEPVRRLAAFLQADRPEVADLAASLLSAAGYETPPAVPDASAGASVYPLAACEGISPEALSPYIASVRRDLADAIVRYGPEPSGAQAFSNPREAAIWDYAGMAATDKVELMAVIRLFDDLGVPAQEENGEGRDAVLCRTQVAHLHDCHYPVTLTR